MRFVLDNSVTMRWLFGDGSAADLPYAGHVLAVLEGEGNAAMVPGIWALEVGNVIVRAEARALVSEARSAEFLGTLQEMVSMFTNLDGNEGAQRSFSAMGRAELPSSNVIKFFSAKSIR